MAKRMAAKINGMTQANQQPQMILRLLEGI
nr:hypothetical protein [Halomonas sp. KO116]